MKLWKYNKATGRWDYQRSVEEETAEQWLDVFKQDEPAADFRIAARRPSKAPDMPLYHALTWRR